MLSLIYAYPVGSAIAFAATGWFLGHWWGYGHGFSEGYDQRTREDFLNPKGDLRADR